MFSSYHKNITRFLNISTRSFILVRSPRTIPIQPKNKNNYIPINRWFASDAVAPATAKPAKIGSSISGLFQRISSFLVGAGLTALGTQYYIYAELHQSNKDMIQKQQEIEKRIMALEKASTTKK